MELLRRGPAGGLAKSASFEVILLLLDAYVRWDRVRDAILLAQSAMRREDEAERYVLRNRLARYHEQTGGRRQALAYLTANFRARPDAAGWDVLRQAAQAVGEWERVKAETWPVVTRADLDLQIRAALDEKDPDLLDLLAKTLGDDDERAIPVRAGVAVFDPERGLGLLLQGARTALGEGGRLARRRAAGFLRAAGRLCRNQEWTDRWAEIRAQLRAEFPPALNWPELGSLLGRDEAEDDMER